MLSVCHMLINVHYEVKLCCYTTQMRLQDTDVLAALTFSFVSGALMLSVGQQEGGVNIACYKYSVSLSVVTAFFAGEHGSASFIGAKNDGSDSDKSSPPTNQHPIFTGPDALPVTQPTVSKH